jgi:hypothetical protein
MSFKATVSAGWTYTTGDTATASNLNALGIPNVTIPDNQTYLVNVGSASTPGIAFNGDANTGLAQLSGADTISIVAGGASPVVFSSDQSAFSNGSDAKPAITFSGDADTGINHDSSNEIEIVCNGAVVSTFFAGGMNVVGNIEADSITVNGVPVLTGGIDTANFLYSTDFAGALTASGCETAVVGAGAVIKTGSVSTTGEGWVSLSIANVSDEAVLLLNASTILSPTGVARWRILTGTNLSNPSERFSVCVGFHSGVSNITPATASGDGVWFQYDDSASAQWQTVTMSAGTRETQTTSVTVATGTKYTLEIRRTASTTYVFYVNNVLVSTHSTVVSLNNATIATVSTKKTVGSGNRIMYVDSLEITNPLVRV